MKNTLVTIIALTYSGLILFQCNEKKEVDHSVNPKTEIKDTIATAKKEVQDVASIKKWYQEAITLADSNTMKNCKEATKDEFYKFPDAEENEKITFVQKAKKCVLNNEYTIYKGDFKGYEWLQNFTFYEKNGKLFFVIYESAAEACGDEARIYYDENLKPIQVLNKTNDCTGKEVGENKTVTSQREITDLNKVVLDRFEEIKTMTK